MYNGKYVDLRRVLEKVYRDNGYTQELDWNDCIEWMGDAVDLIGTPIPYFDKIKCIKIDNFRGPIPCDLHLVFMTRDQDSKVPLTYASDMFHTGYHCSDSPDLMPNCVNQGCVEHKVNEVPSTEDTAPNNQNCNPFFNSNPNMTSNTPYAAGRPSLVGAIVANNLTYSLSNNYIFTSFKNGTVEMSYKAFPMNDDGYPLVPDDTKYIRAVQSYITMKIDYRLWRQDKISEKVYRDSESQWYFNVNSAKNGMNMPSIDEMESIKHSWMRSIPKINQHAQSFIYQSMPEYRYTKNSF